MEWGCTCLRSDVRRESRSAVRLAVSAVMLTGCSRVAPLSLGARVCQASVGLARRVGIVCCAYTGGRAPVLHAWRLDIGVSAGWHLGRAPRRSPCGLALQ